MIDMASALDRLPEELLWSEQWCIAGPDDRGGMKAPYFRAGNSLVRASPTDPTQRHDFESALEYAQANNTRVGFVLQKNDPYICIDLDVKDRENEPDQSKWTSNEDLNRFWRIVQAFDSYTEKSASGKGLHIWIRGSLEKGYRRSGVEVYSQDRFMICTGDVVLDRPIRQNDHMLELLVKEISREGDNNSDELVEIEQLEPDEVIWQRAKEADNSEKFIPLCEGRWQDMGYPSQSEADLALMSMFCFYSTSNEQCRRLFRMTELGKREKATKNDRYLNYTLSRIRGRQERESISEKTSKDQALELIAKLQAERETGKKDIVSAAATVAMMGRLPPSVEQGLPWPPGLLGAIAGYIYNSSTRPVKEVSIVAALGMMAGICGKAWNIPQSGLNLYVILVARSAIGKEAMHSGIASILHALRDRIPGADQFFDFNDFASGPALSKAVATKQSFVNIAGEFGRKLKRMAKDDRMDGPMQQLRTVMTNLYQKSSSGSIVGGISYSNKEQNVASVTGVSYSMIGETTPNTFYDSLTESMMDDGFLSRFTIIEYDGERPPRNYNCQTTPDKPLADAIGEICVQSLTLIQKNAFQAVYAQQEAITMLTAFELECDEHINSTTDEAKRQMWNRAALKVARIAGILAVCDNYLAPSIFPHHVEWALLVVRRDIALFQRKLDAGDIGVDDHTREKKVIGVMTGLVRTGISDIRYPREMIAQGIIPRKIVQQGVVRHNSFTSHRLGANGAFEMTIRSLIDSGDIVEVARDILLRDFSYHGKCYRLIHSN